MKGRMIRKFTALTVALAMVLTAMPAWAYEREADVPEDASAEAETAAAYKAGADAQVENDGAYELEEGTFVPGEAVVVFKAGAVKDQKMSVKAATGMENVDEGFGSTMESTGDEKEAALDAKSEVSILKKSLGDDFVIKDSIAVDDDLIICLIESEKYTTEALIERLSENSDIKSAEPNYRMEKQSTDYSLNDPLSQYVYHVNSPEDNNTAGKNVTSRGEDPEKATSARSGRVTDFTRDHSGDDEVVVAVVDSGINYNHEDLKDMVWTNPGDLGLEGEHGFNFFDNEEEVMDTEGHGTHVSGIIAAEANNAKGLAGVASGTNVKIMMLANSASNDDHDEDTDTAYRYTGSLYYALKAKERGVNIVATSCSWGNPGTSTVYDEIFNKLGEAGVLNFVAAGNHAISEDHKPDYPGGGDSTYMITVGSSNISGKKSGFSNYGKANVDLFASGHNILSTTNDSNYFPNLYTAAERAENTEYYGQFNSTMEAEDFDEELGTNKILPDTVDEGVSQFGEARFFKQDEDAEDIIDPDDGGNDDDDPYADYPEATCELSISTEKTFTDNYEKGSDVKPASLKVTIKDAKPTEKYFLYFPYEKNEGTTGLDNTRYSITTITGQQKADEEHNQFFFDYIGGEVVKYNIDGQMVCKINNDGQSHDCNEMYWDDITQFSTNTEDGSDKLLSYEEAQDERIEELGIGVKVGAIGHNEATPDEQEYDSGVHDIIFYIDSLGVSEPVTEEGKTPEDVFKAGESYMLMSGTSQATPAASGAYAVLASLYPRREGQTGSEYALENRARLFSLVRRTPELEDYCSTGGYLDLSLLNEEKQKSAISDAVCDVDKETLTLSGINMTPDLKLTTKSLAASDASEEQLPSGTKVTFAEDGKSVTITGAKALFGRYIEFILRDAEDNIAATGSFFTVKGQKRMELVLVEDDMEGITGDSELKIRAVMTDKKGKNLYAYRLFSDMAFDEGIGTLYKYNGSKFVECPGTDMHGSILKYYENNLGYNRYQLARGFKSESKIIRRPLNEDNVLYDIVSVTYSPRDGAEEEEKEKKTYLASIRYTDANPEWEFLDMTTSFEDALGDVEIYDQEKLTYAIMDGKIYCFKPSDDVTAVYACDVMTGEWQSLDDYTEAVLSDNTAVVKDGKIYILFGNEASYTPTKSVFSFDGTTWERLADINFVGKTAGDIYPGEGAVCPVAEGLAIFNYSVDGAGNAFIYDIDTGKCRPLYYTLSDGLSDHEFTNSSQSAVETTDGIYYMSMNEDAGMTGRSELYLLSKYSKVYKTSYKDPNPLKVTTKTIKAKYKTLKKKKIVKKAVTVKGAAGKVKYTRGKISCKKKLQKAAKKKITVNSKTGKITLKKGLEKGTYKVKVKVRAAGDDLYKAGTKTVTVKITVK